VPVSVNQTVDADFTIHCSEPSTHSFYFDNEITVLSEHVVDDVPGNNTASTQLTVNALAVADVEVIDQYFDAPPTEINVSQEVVVTLVKVLEHTGYGPVEVEVSKTASASDGASILPESAGEQVVLVGPDPVSVPEQFTIHCDEPSTHEFSVENVVTVKDAHVSDPDGASASTTIYVDCLASADVKITNVSAAPDPILAPVGVNNAVTATVDYHNNGPAAADVLKVVTVTSPANPGEGECSIDGAMVGSKVIYSGQQVDAPGVPDSQVHGFTLDVPAKGACTAKVDVVKSIKDEHVTDPNPDNNSGVDDVLVCSDSDFLLCPDGAPCPDGVADPEAAAADPDCGPADTCPDHYNPGQADTDGDGIGDACDGTSDHDVTVKSLMVFGPAPVNLFDTTGRYLWAIGEIGNLRDHVETVNLSLDIVGNPGCDEGIQQILPGHNPFTLMPLEQKWVLLRTRYECQTPEPGIYPLEITLTIDHVAHDGGDDTYPANDFQTRVKSLLIE